MDWILALSIICGQLIKVPLGMGGVTALDVAVVFILAVSLLKRPNFKKPPLFIKAGLVFLVICVASLLLTPLHLTLQEIFSSFFYTLRWALYLMLGWLAFTKNGFTLGNIYRILFTSGIVLALLGLLQLIFIPDLIFLESLGWDPHYFRTTSTFLDPNFLGAYLVLVILSITQNFKTGKLELLAFTLIYIALLTTFSRSSYFMFLVSFSTLSLLSKSKKLFFISLTLFLGLMVGFWIYTQLITTPHGVDRTASASYRLAAWQQGATIFQTAPILGVGFNSYRFAIRDYNLGGVQFLNSRGSTTNDFSLLYILATTGILGLTSYLFFLAAILKTSWEKLKTNKHLSILILSFLAGLLVHSIFNNSLFYPFLLVWIMLLAAKF